MYAAHMGDRSEDVSCNSGILRLKDKSQKTQELCLNNLFVIFEKNLWINGTDGHVGHFVILS